MPNCLLAPAAGHVPRTLEAWRQEAARNGEGRGAERSTAAWKHWNVKRRNTSLISDGLKDDCKGWSGSSYREVGLR